MPTRMHLGRRGLLKGGLLAVSALVFGVRGGGEARGGAAVVPQQTAAGAIFGPDGSHWPSRTPRVDDTFAAVVEVPPDWTAIARAISDAVSRHPMGKVKIAVTPGAMPTGGGAGSSAPGVLHGLGNAGRDWRILVVPRDGWGTVTAAGTVDGNQGYSLRPADEQ